MILRQADTNILLRMSDRTSPSFSVTRRAVSQIRRSGGAIFIVPQNLVEFWAVATRPVAVNGLGLSPIQADRAVRRIERSFPLLPDKPEIHLYWRALVMNHAVSGRQVHDARLVAAMLAHGVSHLLTFNIADFRRYTAITATSPAVIVGDS